MYKRLRSISQQPPAGHHRYPDHNRNHPAYPCRRGKLCINAVPLERRVNKSVKHKHIHRRNHYQRHLSPEDRVDTQRLRIGNEQQNAGRYDQYQPALRPRQQMLRKQCHRHRARKAQQAQIEKKCSAHQEYDTQNMNDFKRRIQPE